MQSYMENYTLPKQSYNHTGSFSTTSEDSELLQSPLREAQAPIRDQGNQSGHKFKSGDVCRKCNGFSVSFSASTSMVSAGESSLDARCHAGCKGYKHE